MPKPKVTRKQMPMASAAPSGIDRFAVTTGAGAAPWPSGSARYIVITMRRYKNAPMTELTMATMANQYERASTAATITENLAKKPVVNGTPACARRNTVNAKASRGRSFARPL